MAEYEPTSRRPIARMFRYKGFDSGGGTLASSKQIRDLIEPTLTPATYASVRATHVTSDLLTIVALCAMELRRRRLQIKTADAS